MNLIWGLERERPSTSPSPKPSLLNIRSTGEELPPCTATCPLHCNAQGYVALISQGKFKEALALVREKLPFPGILAYACSHPCEKECKRIEEDRPISICHLKRFLVDHVEEPEFEFTPSQEKDQKVAIIGGGPSGLVAAYDLRKMGYQVTLFESRNELGGLLTHGFPSYRLPRQVIEKDLSVINKMGIEIRLNTEVGKDVSPETLLQSFDAIFIGVGIAGAESMTHIFKGLKRTRKGSIQVNPISLETNLKGIFAGGDSVTGPGTIIDSMAHGRKAAISIDRYLRGEDLIEGRESEGKQISPFQKYPSQFEKERERNPARYGETSRYRPHTGRGDRRSKALSQLRRLFGLRRVRQVLPTQSHCLWNERREDRTSCGIHCSRNRFRSLRPEEKA